MKPIKRRDLIAKMEQAGFSFLREGGDHSMYTCPCGRHRTAVPRHREVSPCVMSSINKIECVKGWLG